jgi:hypothetical protein
VLAGAEYGSGSSRDWAAKGPMLLVSSFIRSLYILNFDRVIFYLAFLKYEDQFPDRSYLHFNRGSKL